MGPELRARVAVTGTEYSAIARRSGAGSVARRLIGVRRIDRGRSHGKVYTVCTFAEGITCQDSRITAVERRQPLRESG